MPLGSEDSGIPQTVAKIQALLREKGTGSWLPEVVSSIAGPRIINVLNDMLLMEAIRGERSDVVRAEIAELEAKGFPPTDMMLVAGRYLRADELRADDL
jgi:hypothetical protein